jgi:putative hemolysin
LNVIFLASAGFLLIGSAVLSAADASVFSIGPSRLRTLREEGFRRAEALQAVRDLGHPARAAVHALKTLLQLLAMGFWVSGMGGRGVLEPLALALGGALLLLLLGEGLPRFIAGRLPIRTALVLAPLVGRVEAMGRSLVAPFLRPEEDPARRNGDDADSSEEREVRELTELGRREGVVEEEEHALVERAFRMDELSAWDVMTPRVDILAWQDARTLEEIIPQLHAVPYSRVPVYGQSVDDITGVLYVREAYEAWAAGRRGVTLRSLAREPFFVPGSLPLPKLLRAFQSRRLHMGIVADEFGGTDGLVTLEDVLEELVGEIEDERDIAEEGDWVQISRDEIEVDAALELREINDRFKVSLPHLEHRSLNGFLLEVLGRVPHAGESLEIPGLHVDIVDATDTQVLRARLRRTTPRTEGQRASDPADEETRSWPS